MFYFYTNQLHFTPEFLGRVKLAGSIASLAGVGIYNTFLKQVSQQGSGFCVQGSGFWVYQQPSFQTMVVHEHGLVAWGATACSQVGLFVVCSGAVWDV